MCTRRLRGKGTCGSVGESIFSWISVLHSLAFAATGVSSFRGNMQNWNIASKNWNSDDLNDDSSKRVRTTLRLSQRIEIIRDYEITPSVRYFAEKYQCGQTQIKNILRNRMHYLGIWSRSKMRSKDPARCRDSSLLTAVGLILNEWVNRARCYLINITDDMLRSFGQEIADVIKLKDFNPSNNWLVRFKQKYKILDTDLSIKQEPCNQFECRKPLGISVIIDDLRKEYGDSVIPNPDGNGFTTFTGNDNAGAAEQSHRITNNAGKTLIDSQSALKMDYGILHVQDTHKADVPAQELKDYREALNHLGPLEQFALLNENIRAVGLINQLENQFREELAKVNGSKEA